MFITLIKVLKADYVIMLENFGYIFYLQTVVNLFTAKQNYVFVLVVAAFEFIL